MRSLPRPDPTVAPPPVDDYLATVVEVRGPRGRVTIAPRSAGAGEPGAGPRPAEHLGVDTAHLVTAANPWSIELSDAENAERNVEAAAALDARGLRHVPAEGRDEDATWREPGFAVLDADDEEVLDLALAWCQHGIYRWGADGWSLVLTDGSAPIAYPVRVVGDAPAGGGDTVGGG